MSGERNLCAGVNGVIVVNLTKGKENTMQLKRLSLILSIVIGGAFAVPQAVWAQAVPRSFVASPDVYKVIAENEQYRVIEATWKPRQRDTWHSHGSVVAAYSLTGCTSRLHTPDGKSIDNNTKAGQARIRPVAPSHSFENVGKTECKSILFEPK